MIEKRIYSPWAYTENEKEKGCMNHEIYNELKDKYKIAHGMTMYNFKTNRNEEINLDKYDIVIQCTRHDYGRNIFRIIKNEPNLSTDELALICDGGNLCFGYMPESNYIHIFTD